MNSTPASSITTITLALAAAVLSGCGTTGADDVSHDPAGDNTRITERAAEYAGDPWEKRYRAQFWMHQHIHDSWNPCHIGENVPKRLQGSGPDCWSRLPGHTGR